MKTKLKIKIIKRDRSNQIKEKNLTVEKHQPEAEDRQLVSTMSVWVNEFQKRRYEETTLAFKNLYAQRLRNKPLVSADAS